METIWPSFKPDEFVPVLISVLAYHRLWVFVVRTIFGKFRVQHSDSASFEYSIAIRQVQAIYL